MAFPSGYRELLYIKSTGTQYIDTGVKPNQNTVLKMDVAFLGTAGNNIAGVRNTASDTTNRFGIITFGSASKIGAFFQSSSIQAISFDNSRHEYELSKSGLYVDGTLYGSSNSGSFTCTYPIVLFGWNNGSGGVSATANSVYSCKIYDSSTLIRDFVPAKRTSDSVVGLYDLQNDVFYTNAGTGEFVGVITTGPVDGSGVSIVQATSYGIRAGKTLVDGTAYDIYKGRTLVGGTGYDVSFAPETIPVTITGRGAKSYCYAIINGTTYTSAKSGIEVFPGDTITFGVWGSKTNAAGYVRIDGIEVIRGINGSYTYKWTVPEDCATIKVQMTCSTVSPKFGQIIVTTT